MPVMLSHFGSIGSEFDPERTFIDLDQLRGAAFRVAGMKVLELMDGGPCDFAHSKEPHFQRYCRLRSWRVLPPILPLREVS